ncbi:MAG TPA: hypothetical protein VET46_14020 [Steroidobacteraceae bacterium]|nr:hypothetical protein [Steroidobacteraceae bacterium]
MRSVLPSDTGHSAAESAHGFLPAALVIAAMLSGCAGGPSEQTPPGVLIAGNWRLNHAASDDPQKLIASMRARAQKIIARQYGEPDYGARGPGPRGGAQAPGDNPLGGDESATPSPDARTMRRPDPLRYSPMMQVLSSVIQRGDFLTVSQSSDKVVLDYGTTTRSFVPGARSVVSAAMGVADQVSGWSGRQYVIEQKAQLGPNVREELGLSRDGQQLIDKLRIGPAELPAVDLTRIYDRSAEALPRRPPTTD